MPEPVPALPPRADLHRHLDGSLRPDTLRELAQRHGVSLPADIRFHAGMGLTDALSRFALTLSVLQQPAEVRRVASEICQDALADGVTTLEIRFAPQLHRGGTLREVVEAAAEGVAGRAGLILCGLYGEPPELLMRLTEVAAAVPAVVGLDLAGGPLGSHSFGMKDYAPAFRRAADLGLGRTVHAGEGRPPTEIADAMELLLAQRIGHGTTLLENPAVAARVVEKGVTVEACLTSNVHTAVIPHARRHPLSRWLAQGVSACICTDNTLLSDVTSSSEHALALTADGMTADLLMRSVAMGHAAAFPRRTAR